MRGSQRTGREGKVKEGKGRRRGKGREGKGKERKGREGRERKGKESLIPDDMFSKHLSGILSPGPFSHSGFQTCTVYRL